MKRFVHQVVSFVTLVGYFLAVTWAPAWHDHDHCCHATAEAEAKSAAGESAYSHAHCCSHHHAACCVEMQKSIQQALTPGDAPCQSPLHDEDCVVCRVFSHAPLAAPEIDLVDAVEAVPDWVMVSAPSAACAPPAAYDSRGPPLV